jgi:hypothetical protein
LAGDRTDSRDSTGKIGGVITMGLRELMLVAVVVLVLYGRSGVLKSRQFQMIWPWISPQRRTARPTNSMRGSPAPGTKAVASAERPRPARGKKMPFFLRGNRLYWFLTILAATAVATLILGRMMIASGTGPGLTR